MLRRRLLVEATNFQDPSARITNGEGLLGDKRCKIHGMPFLFIEARRQFEEGWDIQPIPTLFPSGSESRNDPDAGEKKPSKVAAFFRTIFPQVDQFKRYTLRSFVDDLLPRSPSLLFSFLNPLPYAGLAEADPTQALISASFPPLLYFIFGSSRQLSIGPEALVSVVVGTTISNDIEQHPESKFTKLQVSACLTLIVGVLSILLAILRAGFVDNILSGYLLTGFVLGLKSHYVKKRFKGNRILARIPEILILVVVMIVISFTLGLEAKVKPIVPPIKKDLIERLIQPAITIVLVGYIECQTVTRDFGLRYGYFPSGDQELFALGVTNVVVSFLGGYPTFGSLPRSRIMASAGARTTLASAMSGLFVLIFFLTLVPALQFLPRATLSSIVFVAALGLIETREIGFVFRLRAWTEIAMFVATYVITLVFSISTGILLCLGLSALLIVKRTTITSMSVMGRVSHHHLMVPSSGMPSFDKGSGSPFLAPSTVASDTGAGDLGLGKKADPADKVPRRTRSATTLSTPVLTPASPNHPGAKPTFVNIDEHPDAELLDGVILLRVDVPLLFYNSGQARRSIEAVMQAEKRLAIARYKRKLQRKRKEGKMKRRRRKTGEEDGKEEVDGHAVEVVVVRGTPAMGSTEVNEENKSASRRQRREGEEDEEDDDAEAETLGEGDDDDDEDDAELQDVDLPPLSPDGFSDDDGDDNFDAEAGRRWGALHRWRKNRGRVIQPKTSASSLVGTGSPARPKKAGGTLAGGTARPTSTSSTAHLLLSTSFPAGSSSSSTSELSPVVETPGFDDVPLKPLHSIPDPDSINPTFSAPPAMPPKMPTSGQGIRVVFCGLQPFHRILFHRAGLAPVLVGNVFEDMAAAVADVEAKLELVEWRRDA
ncbi:sulfate transporter family-domain-containing protein [Chytridium lagenaria]|nr:sulfate transporter family-domain-containing protein [Chytridium lagenaria]